MNWGWGMGYISFHTQRNLHKKIVVRISGLHVQTGGPHHNLVFILRCD